MLVAHGARGLEQAHRVQVEYRLRLGMIPRLHAIAGQAQDVANTHGGAAENVTLDGDAVLVAAGDLHDRRIADARQQRADRDARHVAIGAAAVGRVDGIDITVEYVRAPIDVLGIGGVGRGHLRGHRELARPQHPLEAARGGMARQDRQRIARYRLVLEDQALSPARSRATRSQDERPASRRSSGGCT
jgi:hypothetical protein